MNLTDQLTNMQNNGKSVVSITYILRHLEESQKNDCPNCKQIPVYTLESYPKTPQIVKEVV